MATYCRLCAEEKSDDDLCASINDLKSGILEKLSACCQWNSYAVNPELPDRVCSMCSEKLEKCWIFSECVSSAQIKLQQLFDDGELTINNETEEDLICDNAESIFVEPITLPDIYPEPSDDFIESTDDLIGSTIENVLDESMSMRECDICQKVFTTGYNLTVNSSEFHFDSDKLIYFKTINRFTRERIPMRGHMFAHSKNVLNNSKVHQI